MINFSNRSVRDKIVFIALVTTLSALVLSSSVMFYLIWNNTKDEAFMRARLDGALFSELVVPFLLFNDKVGANETLSKFHNLDRVTYAHLVDASGNEFANYHTDKEKEFYNKKLALERNETIKHVNNVLILNRPIFYQNEYLGHLNIEFSMKHLEQMRFDYIKMFSLIVLLMIALSYFAAQKMQNVISRPILKLLSYMNKISKTADYKLRITKEYDDEIGKLYDGFDSMLVQIQARKDATQKAQNELFNLNEKLEERVQSRTQNLNDLNIELKDSIDTIKKTQSQLIQSEKMAALGGLVAGVAHEINTPIGLSVTGVTHLQDTSVALKKLYNSNEMSQDDFEDYLDTNIQLCESIYLNLRRGAELVSSFKKVASDQSIEEKRSFKVKEYLEQVLISLRNKLKQTKISVDIICKDDLEIFSDAGAIAQIITNLIINSLIHAFNKGDNGKITLSVTNENNNFIIIYDDNGKGIEQDVLPKVFDPFFTTNRESGGTGLGLNIIYNIVTSTLGGEISVKSKVGIGTTFTIILPTFIDERIMCTITDEGKV